VSQWGCCAIAELAYKNPVNQAKLSAACNYMGDILEAHYKSPVVAKEACRAISILCHGNITNRNKLGASDACSAVPKVLFHHIDNKDITFWAVRAVADIAANHPNNQTKLGGKGACDGLVNVLKRILTQTKQAASSAPSSPIGTLVETDNFDISKPTQSESESESEKILRENAILAKWTCWAIGNIVQLGKGAAMIIEDSGKKPARSMSTQKNTYYLGHAGAAEILVELINLYEDDADTVLWAARAINNMAKSRTLKSDLIQNGALETLTRMFTKYNKNKEVFQWVKLCIETLELSASASQSSLEKTPNSFISVSSHSSEKNLTGRISMSLKGGNILDMSGTKRRKSIGGQTQS
jgi:hypothetical protein